MSRFEARIDQPTPDGRQLVDPGPEQIDPLTAGDLGVQAEVPGNLAQDDQPLGGDLAAGDARNDGVAAVLLDVGQEVVVAVLQRRLLAVEDVPLVEARQDRGDDGLADVAAAPRTVLLDQLGERRDAGHPDDVEQLRAGLAEVLAQGRADRHSALGQQGLEQRNAGAAAGSGLGAGLDAGDVGESLVGDGVADVVLGHRQARADLGIAWQRADADPAALGRDHRDRVAWQRPADERAQQPVLRGVADEDTTEQRGGVVGHDELCVRAAYRVVEGDLQRSLGTGEGVAKAGDVDAHQLELGRGVADLELRLAAHQPRRQDVGHRIARRDQPVHLVPDAGALTDGEDVVVGGAAAAVDHDAAARADLEPAVPGQLVPWPNAGREHHEVEVELVAVGQGRQHAAAILLDLRDRDAEVDVDVELLDQAAQHRTAALVDLQRHQPRRHLDHVRRHPQQPQGSRCLEAEQATADDEPCPAAAGVGLGGLQGCGTDGVEVVEGPVDEATRQLASRHGWHEGVGAGGKDQGVVRDRAPGAGRDGAGPTIDAHDSFVEVQGVVLLVVAAGRDDIELCLGRSIEVGGQGNPVVRLAGLLGEHGHAPLPLKVGGLERLDEVLPDHAVASDDEVALEVRHVSMVVSTRVAEGTGRLRLRNTFLTGGLGSMCVRPSDFTQSWSRPNVA